MCRLECVSLGVSVGSWGLCTAVDVMSVQTQNWQARAYQPVLEAVWQTHLADSQAAGLYF